MFRNYLKTAWRNLYRNKTFSLINIIGLSLGIASTLLILIHVKEELSYDRGFVKASKIYRITQEDLGDNVRHWAATSPTIAAAFQQFFPEVEKTARFYRPYPSQVLSYAPATGEPRRFEERGGFFADSSVVDLFGLQFIQGDPNTALTGINRIVLTRAMAEKYFKREEPVGKTITDDRSKVSFLVTGVVRDFGFNTHIRFDYLLSMGTIHSYIDNASLERKTWNAFYNYVLLKDNAPVAQLERKLDDFIVSYYGEPGKSRKELLSGRALHLQPVTAIHLDSKLEKEMYPNSDRTYVYIFSIAALFILLIAAINFINLSTAQAFHRMKEVGLRKVVGGTKRQLLFQFLGESMLVAALSTCIALILLKWALPFYAAIVQRDYHFADIVTWNNIGMLAGVVVLIGLLSGLYPAWFVSNFNPIVSLKPTRPAGHSGVLRKALITFQFTVSVFMIFSTIVIYRQVKLFQQKNLGFDKEQLIAVTMYEDMWRNYRVMIDELKQDRNIEDFSIISTLPGERFSMQDFDAVGAAADQDIPGSRTMWADDRMIGTLGLKLTAGRNFFNQFPDIKHHEFIVNETAVRQFGLGNPIGKQYVLDGDTGQVVGIVADFNFASLHSAVEPLVVKYDPYRANYLLLRVKPGKVKETIPVLQRRVQRLAPSSVFSYTFIDDKLNLLYESENRMSVLFKLFAGFALFISALGLFGFSAYSSRLRTREVGIRKVLGASLSQVVVLLSGNFMRLVLLATSIALPIGWWLMQRWLEGFAYRVEIGWWIFILAAAATLLLAAFTVSFQVLRAALANPVRSLKSE